MQVFLNFSTGLIWSFWSYFYSEMIILWIENHKKGTEHWPQTQNFQYFLYFSLPDGAKFIIFQTFLLFYLTECIAWNIYGLRHWVAKIKGLENQSWWQKLNFLVRLVSKVKKL